MNETKQSIHISFIVNEEQYQKISGYAKEKGISLSRAVRDIIDRYEENITPEEIRKRIKEVEIERDETIKRLNKKIYNTFEDKKKEEIEDGRKKEGFHIV